MGEFMNGIEKFSFRKGHIFFTEGDTGFFFFVIQEGEVEVYRETLRGNKHHDTLTEGQAFGEFALVSNEPRSATARAVTDGSAYKVSEENYKKLLADLPGWATAILEGLIKRIRKTNEVMSDQTF